MPIINQNDWSKWKSGNIDPYGKACVDVAEEVMLMLDVELEPLVKGYHPTPNTAHSFICRADKNINAGGLSGFQAGAVCSMVKKCHSRGEEFYNSFRGDE